MTQAMTDIVERLRSADISGHGEYSALVRDAANEIERLRQQLWLAREDMAHLVQQIDAVLGPR